MPMVFIGTSSNYSPERNSCHCGIQDDFSWKAFFAEAICLFNKARISTRSLSTNFCSKYYIISLVGAKKPWEWCIVTKSYDFPQIHHPAVVYINACIARLCPFCFFTPGCICSPSFNRLIRK